MVIWGDVAYVNGMLFSPDFWRAHFKPIVAEQIRICHEAGLPVIYHGCGNASAIFEDFIEMGLDSYNPSGGEIRAGRRGPAQEVRPPHGVLREHGRARMGPCAPGGAATARCCES